MVVACPSPQPTWKTKPASDSVCSPLMSRSANSWYLAESQKSFLAQSLRKSSPTMLAPSRSRMDVAVKTSPK